MSARGRIDFEISKFNESAKGLGSTDKYSVDKLNPYIFKITPSTCDSSSNFAPLTILGLTHGNEWVGVSVLNRLITLLEMGVVNLELPICVALGNLDAARKGVRFIESDLNRSFGLSERKTEEHSRAEILEDLLSKTSFLLDIHQTIEPSQSPFFIFPYSEACYKFARCIDDTTPIVTHWGHPFSKDGQCSDEFVNSKGGVGVTIELGQAGFDFYQESYGLRICLQTIAVVNRIVKQGEVLKQLLSGKVDSHLFTFAETVSYPEGAVELEQGLKNFQKVSKGQLVAKVDDQPHLLSQDGWMLFPKYVKDNQVRPKELYRILKKIRREELPAGI